MESHIEELGENCIVNVEENFLQNKCFCVKLFYRASRLQFTCSYFGVTILVVGALVATVLKLDEMKFDESFKQILIILVTFVYLAISLCLWAEFKEKEEYLKNLRGEPMRKVKIQPPMDSDEEDDEVISSLEEADLPENEPTAREDSSSPPEGGEEIIIPIVGEGVGKNVGHLVSVCVHNHPVSSGESSSSAEVPGRGEDSAANSERRDGSGEEVLQALLEASSPSSTEASFENAAYSGEKPINDTASSHSPGRK